MTSRPSAPKSLYYSAALAKAVESNVRAALRRQGRSALPPDVQAIQQERASPHYKASYERATRDMEDATRLAMQGIYTRRHNPKE